MKSLPYLPAYPLGPVLLVLVLLETSCDAPSDPIALGTLCIPATSDCPSSVRLSRTVSGRNAMDLHLTGADNTSEAGILIRITTEESLNIDRPRDESERLILYEDAFGLSAGESITERLGSFELTVAREFTVETQCLQGTCNHRLEYLTFASPIECYEENQCGRAEFCEYAYGRCSECTLDSQCADQQSCDLETGTCFPGGSTGCTSVPADYPSPTLAMLLVALLIISWRRRVNPKIRAILPLCVVIIVICLPASALGAGSASMTAGGGIRLLTGDMGKETRTGWGIAVRQELRQSRIGLGLQLAGHSFTFRDPSIPNELRLRGYSFALGPRYFQPLPLTYGPFVDSPLEAIIGAEYTLWGISENRRSDLTGLDLSYHALGGSFGLGWNWNGITVQSRAYYAEILDWPGGVFTLDLTVGLER